MRNSRLFALAAALTGLTIVTLLTPMFPGNAVAFVKFSPQLTFKEKPELNLARKLFVTGLKETSIKAEAQALLKKDRKQFLEKLENGVSNDADYQSYLFEVRDGVKVVEKAKRIAQLYLYRAVQKNWPDLQNTVFNDVGAGSPEEFEPLLRDRLQTTHYTPPGALPSKGLRDLEFRTQDWGRVVVTEKNGKLIRVRWALDVSSPHSGNKMQPGWESITAEE